MGHEVSIVSPADFATLPCPSYPEIRLALRPGRGLRRRLDAFAPDTLHVATEGPLGVAARRYSAAFGRGFTTSLHTRFPEYLRLRAPIPLRWSYAYLRWFHRPAARTMVATDLLKQELEARGLRHLAIWSRGVDTDLFRPRAEASLPGARPMFGYVGRVAVEKNIGAFLALDLPGSKCVIGDGPDLTRLQRAHPAVQFLGYKIGLDLARAVAAADVVVFPSKTDTFGLTIIEALACGVPVAAYPVQGPAALIRNGENGYLDEDLQAAALACLRVDRTACRASVAPYTWKNSAQQFLANLVPLHAGTPAVS
jgi:glycosyltransferase involved in cell wall biosynthesis